MTTENQESFLMKHIFTFLLLGVFGALGIGMIWFQYEMTNPNGDVQQALSKEQAQLDQVKGDCKALGTWIINQGANPLNLDGVVDQAKNIYMVNCK